MKGTVTSWTIRMQVLITLLVVGGFAFGLLGAVTKPLGAENLRIDAADLRSFASEGKLIAEQVSSGKFTSAFLRSHTSQLRDETEKVIRSLDSSEPEAGLEERVSQARGLAKELRDDLNRLSSSFENQQEAGRIGGSLEKVAARASELEKSLPQ